MYARQENAVTGALGYTGKYIARRLLALGESVKTLTGHPHRPNPFGDRISVSPFDFDPPDRLVESLRGVRTLYNTYWARFAHGEATFERAIANTKKLVQAAATASVQRLVHISITNPSPDSPLPYFRGKAELEQTIRGCGLSHAIVRPTVIFGDEDILINNIAWLLRHSPVFVVPGRGDYHLQPVFVEDVARIAVECGRREDNIVTDAVGPEVYTFGKLVRLIAKAVNSRAAIVRAPRGVPLLVGRVIGWVKRDTLVTRDELAGLMANLLVSSEPPRGATRLSDWLRERADSIGRRYASELRRHFD